MELRTNYDDLPSFQMNPFIEAESKGYLMSIFEQARITKIGGNSRIQLTAYVVGVNNNRTELFYTTSPVLIKSNGEVKGVHSWVGDLSMRIREIERYEILATAEEIFKSAF